MNERHRFQLWQDGIMVAAVDCASREYALKEIGHYAAVYGQDGPVNIVEVKRKPGVVGCPADERGEA
jgi:hypothetical protein